jgi:hypothetical protein
MSDGLRTGFFAGSPARLAGPAERWYRSRMTQLAQELDKKLTTWRPEAQLKWSRS